MSGGHLALTVLSVLMELGAAGAAVTGIRAYIRVCRTPESEEARS